MTRTGFQGTGPYSDSKTNREDLNIAVDPTGKFRGGQEAYPRFTVIEASKC